MKLTKINHLNQINLDLNNTTSPFQSLRWHQLYHQVFDTNPLILTDNQSWIGIFEIHKDGLHFHGGEEISDYMDIIGSDKAIKSAWPKLTEYFKSHGINQLKLTNVSEDSPTFHYFNTKPSATITQEDTTPLMELPSDWETFLTSLKRKHRKELKRKLKNYDSDYPKSKIIESANPDQDINILIEMMKQDEAKDTFLTPPMELFFRRLAIEFKDDIELLFLCTNDQAVAAILSFTHHNQRLLYNSGFSKEQYSGAGFYLKASAIKRAIDQKVDTYNFLQGNERYKYELGAQDHFVYTIAF